MRLKAVGAEIVATVNYSAIELPRIPAPLS